MSDDVSGDSLPPSIEFFQEANLIYALLRNLQKFSYTTPTPTQKVSIPLIMAGHDLFVCAEPASGKNAAFLLPLINKFLTNKMQVVTGRPQALVVTSTRKLAVRIYNEARKFACTPFSRISVLHDGRFIKGQTEQLAADCHILVATPGHLNESVNLGKVFLTGIRCVVLDQVDHMLEMGFRDDVARIMEHETMAASVNRQTLMFSAKFPAEVQALARQYLNNYIYVAVGTGDPRFDSAQKIVHTPRNQKLGSLLTLFGEGYEDVLVFVETKKRANSVARLLSDLGYPAISLHGNQPLPNPNTDGMNIFIATSAAVRGIYKKKSRHVVNYEMPKSINEYIHRIGSMGKRGRATSFFDPDFDFDIAENLIEVLEEANQNVPDFLWTIVGGKDLQCNRRGDGPIENNCDSGIVRQDTRRREIYIPSQRTNNNEMTFYSDTTSGLNVSENDQIPLNVTGDNPPPPIGSFEEANLMEVILTNVQKSLYTTPAPIQMEAIPIILAGRDLLACAQTRSGKNAAFLLPLINKLLTDNIEVMIGRPQALVVTSTRESAIQIFHEIRKFAFGSYLKVSIIFGGMEPHDAINNLKSGCHIFIATPGRLNEALNCGTVTLNDIRCVVLDQADRMLKMNSRDFIPEIMQHATMAAAAKRQTLIFSGTFPKKIQELADQYLNNYIYVSVGVIGGACSDGKQTINHAPEKQKLNHLMGILEEDCEGVLVFVDSKERAEFLSLFLSELGYPAASIHGDHSERQRQVALYNFKSGGTKILIATSAIARDLDIRNALHVINYDMPKRIVEYIFCIGRSGRIGQEGRATSFFDPNHDQDITGNLVHILERTNQDVPDFLRVILGGGLINHRN